MKSLSVLAALAFADVAIAATCNADNCARAVTGTIRQLTSTHYADCASFMACTVTPAAVAATSVVTVTVTATPVPTTVTLGSYPENLNKRIVTSPASAVTNCPSAVPAYASACSGTVRYSSACSCFGATRRTVTASASTTTLTTTVTATLAPSVVTVSPALPTLCGNAGLQWASFRDFQPDYDQEQTLQYDPTVIKTYTPDRTGVTNYLHYAVGSVYGQPDYDTFFTIEHRGYIFAPETGTYNFTASNVDNNWFMWIGPQAYSGWTKANAQQDVYLDLTNGYYGQAGGSGTYTMSLQAGMYYPFRAVYHNDRGPATFDYSITAPSGYQVIGNNPATAMSTPFVVQYSCDGQLAPAYPPFGQET